MRRMNEVQLEGESNEIYQSEWGSDLNILAAATQLWMLFKRVVEH